LLESVTVWRVCAGVFRTTSNAKNRLLHRVINDSFSPRGKDDKVTPKETRTSDAITFVSCIERGRLEDETILMLETLRRNGGALANSRALVVVGRRGAPLADSTKKALSRLNAELIYDRTINPAPWFNYANKLVACTIAQRLATTPLVAWLDSDVLIAAEPIGLLLKADEDFAGRCEFLPPAMHKGDPVNVPYWQKLCALVGVRPDQLPFVRMEHLDLDMRLNFNSGVFVWRKSSTFAKAYFDTFVALLKSRLAQHDGNFFTADQVIIAPILIAQNLRWKHLDLVDHHMVFQGMIDGTGAAPDMSKSSVIHYSRSLTPPYRDRFLARLEAELPAVHAMVTSASSLDRASEGSAAHAMATLLKAYRGARWRLYAAQVKAVPRGQ
jgi:hypothetical protein